MKAFLTIGLILIVAVATGQSFEPDKITDVNDNGKEGSLVALKGDVIAVEKDILIELKDQTGSIKIDLSGIEDVEVRKDDHISVNGKITVSENGERIVKATYFRKHSYVKDPSRCCKTTL